MNKYLKFVIIGLVVGLIVIGLNYLCVLFKNKDTQKKLEVMKRQLHELEIEELDIDG